MVKYLDFTFQHQIIRNELIEAFAGVVDSNYLVLGNQTQKFDEQYAKYCKTKYSVGVSNGLDALILALRALGIGYGDEVIVPSNTYIATWLAVSAVGAIPIPAEPDLRTYNITSEGVASKLSERTKAVIPVHLYGQACEMDAIVALCNQKDLYVVEDCAQAHGAEFNGTRIGGFGQLNGHSFYPTKNLGAIGESGAVTTNSQELAQKVASLRNYGQSRKYYNDEKGVNNRIDEVQAAILNVKLKYIDQWTEQRRRAAAYYLENLRETDNLVLPYIAEGATHVWHLFVVRHPERDRLAKHLEANGVGYMIHYPVPPHLQKAYSELGYKKGDLPIAEEIADTCLSLPLYPGISDADLARVVEVFKGFN